LVEGPARYSSRDVAAAFSRALGKPVELKVIPREQCVPEQGFSPEAAASAYARMTAVSVDGGFEMPDDPESGKVTLQSYISELVEGGA
jgi:hypothetical protein